MITTNMSNFIQANRVSLIVLGDRRTPEDKPVKNKRDLDNSDRVKYKLADGSIFTVTREDVSSAPEYKPQWDL